MEYLCKLLTPNPEGTIVDMFMGSGTTGIAALQSSYNFIGFEKDETYFNIAKTRIEKMNEIVERQENTSLDKFFAN